MSMVFFVRNISANAAAPMGLRHANDEHAFDGHIGKYVVSHPSDAKNYSLYATEEMHTRFKFPDNADLNDAKPKYGYWKMELE